MNNSEKEFISAALSVGVIALALFIIHRFIPSLVWAAIIAIATYPLYRRWRQWFGTWQNLSAFLFTTALALLLLIPLSWLLSMLVKEVQLFVSYLQEINHSGGRAPAFFYEVPIYKNEIVNYWNQNIGNPGDVKELLSNMHLSLTPASYFVKQVGASLVHRSAQVGFTFLTLFFFFRDGDKLFQQIHLIGEFCLGKRWPRYADRLPAALRATVNGTIVVGIGVGILMGICYAILNFPGPVLMGFITALAAMIPFVVPLVFMVVAFILFANGSVIAATIVLVWGTIVMFVSDHFIKPVLIGGAIQLPFLAVLFGILGGVETLGLLGLFVGPIIMVLFLTLWHESQGSVQPRY